MSLLDLHWLVHVSDITMEQRERSKVNLFGGVGFLEWTRAPRESRTPESDLDVLLL